MPLTSLANIDDLRFREITTPTTPATNTLVIYFKADGLLYRLDDLGVESLVGGGGANPITTFGNKVRNFPSLQLAVGTGVQPDWWSVTNDPVLTEVFATVESVPVFSKILLKLVVSVDGAGVDFAYQQFDETTESDFQDNITKVSCSVVVYQKSADPAGTITLELFDQDGSASLGTDTTAVENTPTFLSIEDVLYQDSMRWRITHSANNGIIYFARPNLNDGIVATPWQQRSTVYRENLVGSLLNINPSNTTFNDLDVSANTSPLTVGIFAVNDISEPTATGKRGYVRRNGSTVPQGFAPSVVLTQNNGIINSGSYFVLCDANQIIETSVENTVITIWRVHLKGYQEWE